MNIFYLSSDPIAAAQMQVDKHVVKMILETAQLLSTAHRLLDGTEYIDKRYVEGSFPPRYRNVKRWRLADDINDQLMYQATHINHPSAVWCRQSNNNYNWLFYHFVGLMDEYHYRYGKSHACAKLTGCLQSPPMNIPIGPKTQPTPAMDAKYIVSKDSVENYRNYYIHGKSHLHKYTKRQMPEWLRGSHENIQRIC